MSKKDLRKLSIEFRRVSSNFLSSTNDTADINLKRFVNFINNNELINKIIKDKIANVDYNFRDCFKIDESGWVELDIPVDEAKQIKAQYDYLSFIDNEEGVYVLGQAMRYYHSSNKFDDIIQNFIDKAFKPFIDYINDQISMEMLSVEEDLNKNAGDIFIQNINSSTGVVNQQGIGTIISNITVNPDIEEILVLTDRLISSLSKLQGVDADRIENVRDDLESVQEQMKSEAPKKKRLTKALGGIREFVKDVISKVAISYAASGDWNTLLQKLGDFIREVGQ